MGSQQLFGDAIVGKTIQSFDIINCTQAVITFTDGTHTTFTARLSGDKPWIGQQVMTGHIEKEWREVMAVINS